MKILTLALIVTLNFFFNSIAFASHHAPCPSSSTTSIPFGYYREGCKVTNNSTLQIGPTATLRKFTGTSPQITVERYSALSYANLTASQSIKILPPSLLNNAKLTTGDLCIAGSGQSINWINAKITCNRTNRSKHYFLFNGVGIANINCTEYSSPAIPNCM